MIIYYISVHRSVGAIGVISEKKVKKKYIVKMKVKNVELETETKYSYTHQKKYFPF